MLINGRSFTRCFHLLLLLSLGACAPAQMASYTVKQFQKPSLSTPSRRTGEYKVGDPYQVAGVWYYPKVDLAYRETGIASWYGPGFHGRLTANGEIYNQDDLTAAHRTLPLTSMVRVTNLENGRSIILRVNDRGPFKSGRIIDLSRRAAELLGFIRKGTAKVEVLVLETESRQVAAVARRTTASVDAPEAAPRIPVFAEPLDGINGSRARLPKALESTSTKSGADQGERRVEEPWPDGKVTRRRISETKIYVQAGSFLRRDNAARLSARLSAHGRTSVTATQVDDRLFYRVRLGPLNSVSAADKLLATLVAKGYTDATVVVD
jgi:rare lipoprotein A